MKMNTKEGGGISEDVLKRVPKIIEKIKAETSKIVMGQTEIVEHLLRSILCNGHILIEGVPGTAKTLIVKTVATITGCDMKRVQFTVDLLPSDILGINAFNPDTKEFTFKKGPVFTNFLIADEINRSPPKTQSALLQAMQEKQISAGNKNYTIEEPFFVMATQNPIEQSGVYNLPEAEVDRFLFKINIDYPKFEDEIKILDTNVTLRSFEHFKLEQVITKKEILQLQEFVKKVYSSDEIKKYIIKVIESTRDKHKDYSKYITIGSSPRGSIALHVASKAQALMEGRNHVLPEDIRNVAKPVLRHRIVLNYLAEADGMNSDKIIDEILNQLSPA